MTLSAGTTISQYRITAALGSGGMGEVWRAEDTKLGRQVALKVLPEEFAADPDRMARFEREARVLASLNHPNIAHLYGLEAAVAEVAGGDMKAGEASAGLDEQRLPGGKPPAHGEMSADEISAGDEPPARRPGTGEDPVREGDPASSIQHPASGGGAVHFLVMELAEGEELSDRIARGPIPVDEAVPIALQIAEALEAAHEQGIVHRDLKPANIKLAADGTVKVLDFGLAKAWEAEPGADLSMSPTLTRHATAAGVILGTAAYMSPEQARGQAVDRKADIWAFGVVLWEMLTGRQLYQGETVSDVLASVLKESPDLEALPADTPANLRRVVTRCLEKDPRRRLQWIGDARIELGDIDGDGEPIAADAIAPPDPRGRRASTVALAAVVVAAVAAAAGFLIGHRPPIKPDVVRFDLAAPEGTSYHLDALNPGPVAVSPDGTRLAFSARDADGLVQLYLRSLDSTEARKLSGSEGAQYPFWSPDSRSIGFFADGKLKRVDADGGPAVTLCDADNGKGGSWSRSGQIIFAPTYNGPLQRVAEVGGEPTAVTVLDEARNDNSHRHPRCFPDGEHFIYLARTGDESGQGGHAVVLGSFDDQPERVLLRSPLAAELAAGRLIYVRENTLMSRPFDADRLEFTGEAVPISDVVLTIPGAAVGVFSGSANGVLAYIPRSGHRGGVLTWFDREGQIVGTLGEPEQFGEVWLSPDGTMAAVSLEGDLGQADVWIYEIDRGVISRFTSDPGQEEQLVWSPDSRSIAFARSTGGSADIYVKTIGGGPAQPLLKSELNTFPTTWSPDGRLLGFDAASPDTNWDQWILPLDGGEPYPFLQTEFREINGVFSPDGTWMAFSSDDSGRQEIYVTPFPGPGRRWRVSTEGGEYPSWSSTGREIFFNSLNNQVMAVPVEPGNGSITISTPEVVVPANVAPLSYPYSPAPGGDRVLVITQQLGPQSLRVVLNWDAELDR